MPDTQLHFSYVLNIMQSCIYIHISLHGKEHERLQFQYKYIYNIIDKGKKIHPRGDSVNNESAGKQENTVNYSLYLILIYVRYYDPDIASTDYGLNRIKLI